MSFDPKRHIMKLKGKDYLPIAARLIWFRDEHPDWGIVTTPVEINMEKQYAIFSASIFNGEGKLMATATKMENVQGFGDFIEKAETGSVGRALAYCGFGTQFAPELEEGGRFADSPYGGGMGANRFASGSGNGNGSRPNTYGNNGGGNGNGGNAGGYNNAPRPNGNGNNGNGGQPVQAARPAPAPMRHDDDFGGDDGEGDPAPSAPPRPAAQTAVARPPAPAPTPPAAPAANNGVMRVREPERDFADPGGDDDSDEDPFADDEDTPLAAASVAKPVGRAAQTAPAAAPAPQNDDEDDAPIAPPPTGNKCAAEGCGATMPPAMVAMTTAKFGKPLCPVHQKEATPIIGGNMAVGANVRPRAKAGAGASSGGDGGLL